MAYQIYHHAQYQDQIALVLVDLWCGCDEQCTVTSSGGELATGPTAACMAQLHVGAGDSLASRACVNNPIAALLMS